MSVNAKQSFEFGPFHLDPGKRRLTRDGEPVQLSPKTVEVLTLLVRRNGSLVDKDCMLEELWPDTFVEEANLAVHISSLRKALGEKSPGEKYIETVPRRGYRFSADVREIPPLVAIEERERTEIVFEPVEPVIEKRPFAALPLAVLWLAVCVAAAPLVYMYWPSSQPARRESAAAKTREAVLRGRYFWNQRTAAGIDKSIACFREAIALDAEYAPAYAGLADAYAFDVRRWEEAENLARQALEIDPSLGEPHATIGFIRMYWRHDWETAGTEFALAVDRAPGYATGQQWYALFLAARGDLAAAESRIRLARDLDPLSLAINLDLARVLFFARRYDECIEQCRKTVELDARFAPAYLCLHDAFVQKGLHPEAFQSLIQAWETFGRPASEIQAMKDAFGYGGLAAVLTVRGELELHALSRGELAECAALLGDGDKAASLLEAAFEQQDLFVVFLRVHPAFDSVRDHPRLRAIERKLNLAG